MAVVAAMPAAAPPPARGPAPGARRPRARRRRAPGASTRRMMWMRPGQDQCIRQSS